MTCVLRPPCAGLFEYPGQGGCVVGLTQAKGKPMPDEYKRIVFMRSLLGNPRFDVGRGTPRGGALKIAPAEAGPT